jgi:hypothetical protein
MNLMAILIIGGVIGAVEGGSVFFAREEPYKTEILLAATLKGVLVGLLTGLSLGSQSLWWHGAGLGSLYGLAFALVVFLAKGGIRGRDAPYVVPSGLVTGGIIGGLVVLFAYSH